MERFFTKFTLNCADEFITTRKSVLQANHNIYSDEFRALSAALRSKGECHGCFDKFDPKDLDTHHLDGDASNDRELNLKVLCLHCHINEPNHGHYRTLLEQNGRLNSFYSRYPKKRFLIFV